MLFLFLTPLKVFAQIDYSSYYSSIATSTVDIVDQLVSFNSNFESLTYAIIWFLGIWLFLYFIKLLWKQ